MQKPRTSLEIVRVFAIAALGEGTPAERVDADIREPLAARELIILTWAICTRRAGKLYEARSRLHRSQILQVNIRWKALAEIYTMHSFAPFSNLNLLLQKMLKC